jgi:competence protein ComEC
MRFSDYPFLKYLPILIGGVLCAQQLESFNVYLAVIGIVSFWLVYFLLVNHKTVPRKTLLISFIGYLLIFCLGFLLVNLKTLQKLKPKIDRPFDSYLAEVRQFDIQKPNSFENLLAIKAVERAGEWRTATGSVLVYHQALLPLIPGQILLVKKTPEQIEGPKNPHEFDYRAFLLRKGIHFRQFIGDDFLIIDSLPESSIDFLFINLRSQLADQLGQVIPDSQSEQVAMALLLGQKQSLDRNLRDGYVQAGVMHILAVSGLHVGIIYALLLVLFKPLKLSKKWAKFYLILVVLLIWIYAILTGLSPSVVRASIMFSLLTLGQMRERKPSIFNVLAFSAMLMIALDPEVIFELGFQLSYLAVAGIVLIQPLILNWWLPKNRILEYFWQLTSVSIAAQLATFPLSVFYFHLFPTYFLLGNLLVIPLAFLIMQVGVPLLLVGWIPGVGSVLGWVLSQLIWIQNQVVLLIQTLPWGKIDRLTISVSSMIFCWLILLIWAGWAMGNKKQLIYIFYGMVFIWSGLMLVEEIRAPRQAVVIYQGKKGQAFDYSLGDQVFSWNAKIEPEELSFIVDPNRIATQLPLIPKPIIGVPHSVDQILLFPSSLIYNMNASEIYFGNQNPREIEIWSEGKWKKKQHSDTLKLGDAAFRILF